MPEAQLSLETVAVRLLLAVLFCMAVGWERERKQKPAGLKTHMLVGLGASAFFLIFIEFAMGPMKDAEQLMPDPTRVFEGVITGIGFLGAGAIIQGGGDIRGLTTGAGIWVSGAIGLACGGGYYIIAGFVTAFTLFILIVAGWAEHRFMGSGGTNDSNEERGRQA